MMIKKITLLSLLLFSAQLSHACTTILIGKQCTIDGSVILAHNEDMGFNAIGRLWHSRAIEYPEIQKLKIPYVSIPLKQKYAYWASGNSESGNGLGFAGNEEGLRNYHNILTGMNEHGLTMACNWMNSKEIAPQGKGINRYALRQLILESCNNAHEAVLFIGEMIESYGQADWGGLTYCLADNTEAWVVETTASQWVARRVKDNEIWAVANQYTIEEEFDLHSKNIFEYALKNKWYVPSETFNFKKVYGKPEFLDTHYDQKRENRIHQLLDHKKGIISVFDIMEVLRDRYDETPDFRLPISKECWREYCIQNNLARPISSNIAQSSFIAHLRNGQKQFPNLMWFSFGTPHFNGYFPVYAQATAIPTSYSEKIATNHNAWLSSKALQKEGDMNYMHNRSLAASYWASFENRIYLKMQNLESKEGLTQEMISTFTHANANALIRKQHILLQSFLQKK